MSKKYSELSTSEQEALVSKLGALLLECGLTAKVKVSHEVVCAVAANEV